MRKILTALVVTGSIVAGMAALASPANAQAFSNWHVGGDYYAPSYYSYGYGAPGYGYGYAAPAYSYGYPATYGYSYSQPYVYSPYQTYYQRY
jgi:hypothetical protein